MTLTAQERPPVPAPTGEEPAERGQTTIATRVVERIAARVVGECQDVGGAGSSLLGISLSSARQDGDAEVSARLHGQRAVSLTVRCSVPYPRSVRQATTQLRERLTDRVGELTGMTVRRVDITVTALTTTVGRRVQ
ncbi:MAG TPA: Asp23/Gls24 family envelope stress response protein [Pseudonocardiaceae bacterium]|nr:Asp23/Gls24 family envelope stress response protein [Pseudonocardiaceae bacterium]